MARISILVMILAASGFSANGQALPEESRARLAMFVGSWTVLGQEDSFSETCGWYHNKSFIVCDSEEKQPRGVLKGVSILGYSELAGTYTYYNYNSTGGSRALIGFANGDEWRFTGERLVRGDVVRYQVLIRPTNSGFAFREERSVNGGAWAAGAEVSYIRRK
jgi:hypothetical protein